MPHPNDHDQPAEGGSEQVERALRKQQEPDRKGQQKSKIDSNPSDRAKTQPKTPSR